jgi:uncharacterized protein (TIGR02145 family)
MKKIFFLSAMLVSVAAGAQTLNIKIATVDYAKKTAVCDVSWTGRNTTHLSDVWVFVDSVEIPGTAPAGGGHPAAVTGATVTQKTTGNASASTVSGNTRGVWVKSVTSGANFTGQITLQLSGVPEKFNACAYATDYPPNVTLDKGTYTFKGTANFIVNNPAQTVTSKTIAKTNLTVNSSTTFTDVTGCPGIGNLYCPYTGSDLFIDATHLCRQRPSGAQNWEAWIKDARDNELYRIVLMPDNKWWLAQNLKYAAKGVLFQSCGKDSCGRFYTYTEVFNGNYAINQQTICPSGWVLPSNTQWSTMATSISSTLTTAWQDMRSQQAPCTPNTDKFGWATKGRNPTYSQPSEGDAWWSTTGNAESCACLDNDVSTANIYCNAQYWWLVTGHSCCSYAVRCLRP